MTKKDYLHISEVLRRAMRQAKGQPIIECTIENIVVDMSAMLVVDNIKFNKEKFLDSCGVK